MIEPRTPRINPGVAHLLKLMANTSPTGKPLTTVRPSSGPYPLHVEAELASPAPLSIGATGLPVRRVQEWLSAHGFGTAVDGQYGPATARALSDFQTAHGLTLTTRLEAPAWKLLVAPLAAALAQPAGGRNEFDSACLETAGFHLKQHPLEIGGENRGPWVRTYMKGNEGHDWPWCAGFVSFVLLQTALRLGTLTPIDGSLSCDTLAGNAQRAGRFVNGDDVRTQKTLPRALGEAFVFLVRGGPGDWVHTGFGFNLVGGTFSTIEGNTNDDGSRNGFEVCSRTRSVADKDFILIT